MILVAVSVPPIVYALLLAWIGFWALSLQRAARPTPLLVNAFCALAVFQLSIALIVLGLTAQGAIDRGACLLGVYGLYGNALAFMVQAVALALVLMLARARLDRWGGAKLPVALLVISWLTAVVHMRSALLCTV